MHSSLFFTTLFTSFFALSFADSLYVNTPTNLVQCTNTTLTWGGGEGPYDVYVFTDCDDDNDTPIGQFLGVTNTWVTWAVNQPSGAGIFVEIDDASTTVFSANAYIGGDASQAAACEAEVSADDAVGDIDLAPLPSNVTATVTSTSSSGSVPTTLSHTTTATLGGVDDAEGAPGTSSGAKTASASASGTPSPTPNGASSLMTRPMELSLGLLATVGLALFL